MFWRTVTPSGSDYMLVEVLPGAKAEDEPPVREDSERRRLLGDHSGVVADGRAGDVGHEFETLGGVRDRAQPSTVQAYGACPIESSHGK